MAIADKHFIFYRLNFVHIIPVSRGNEGPAINFILSADKVPLYSYRISILSLGIQFFLNIRIKAIHSVLQRE